jgi:aerobic carbon-monoxide dehydrogenase medium subunit
MGEEAALGGRDDRRWYLAPTDIGEAIEAVARGGRVLAGGTDFVASMNLRGERPERVVWIGRLGLDEVSSEADRLRVGAGVSLSSVATDAAVGSGAAALATAARRVAGPAVRNLATVGGSLCAAWPRSDVGCAALGLDALVLAAGPGGERQIPMAGFYAGPGRTALERGEIVRSLLIRPTATSGFAKIGRRSSMTLAVVNAAARLDFGPEGAISEAVVAVGAGHAPQRAPSVEAALLGRLPQPEVVAEAAREVLHDVELADDEHATAWYRGRVAPVAVARALTDALAVDPP